MLSSERNFTSQNFLGKKSAEHARALPRPGEAVVPLGQIFLIFAKSQMNQTLPEKTMGKYLGPFAFPIRGPSMSFSKEHLAFLSGGKSSRILDAEVLAPVSAPRAQLSLKPRENYCWLYQSCGTQLWCWMDSYRHAVSWWGLDRAELQRFCVLQGAGEAIAAAELSTAELRAAFLYSSVIPSLYICKKQTPGRKLSAASFPVTTRRVGWLLPSHHPAVMVGWQNSAEVIGKKEV